MILYLLTPYILALFPKKGIDNNKTDRVIYLYYDALHTNIILDVRRDRDNWIKFLPNLLNGKEFSYLEFGLGDKETYLNTKYWSNLSIKTALKALFLDTDSVIHVSYYKYINVCALKEIRVNEIQYRAVIDLIKKSFGKKVQFISNGYFGNDKFYKAIYRYNLLFTCNTWVAEILKEANITAIRWSPLSYPLIISL